MDISEHEYLLLRTVVANLGKSNAESNAKKYGAAIGIDIWRHRYLVGADLFSIFSTETNAAQTRPYTAKVNNNVWWDYLRSFFSLLNYGYTILANSGVGKQF